MIPTDFFFIYVKIFQLSPRHIANPPPNLKH
jgi:hypothetical protein